MGLSLCKVKGFKCVGRRVQGPVEPLTRGVKLTLTRPEGENP